MLFIYCIFFFKLLFLSWAGDVAELVEHQTGAPLTQVQFLSAARDFSPLVSSQRRLSFGACTPPCATACINICVHIKDPVVHVRVWWIMKTLKQPACTIEWVACLSQLAFPMENNLNWEKSHLDNTEFVTSKKEESA